MNEYYWPDEYNFTDSSDFTQILQILIPFFIILSVLAVFGLVTYIIKGIAINRMSQARGLENGWLGFIPYARDYQLGTIAGEIQLGNKTIKKTGLCLVLTPIIFGFVFSIGYVIMMVPFFIQVIALGEYATPEQVMGPLTTFMFSVFIFVIIMLVAQVILYLIKYLALHKIFSQYSSGQKPVFYMIIAMFVPFASAFLLLMHSERPLLEKESEQ